MSEPLVVHLVDGTYELFRHFYGARRFNDGKDAPLGAVAGVLGTVLEMIEGGATHIGVATDHVIESFRNDLWAGYKTGVGIERALASQFHPLEEALTAMGVVVWPMVELEADDALASAAHLAVRAKFGVDPPLIPDYLALVGDSADGYPGIPGIGPKGAAQLLNRHGALELFPLGVLGERHAAALLFKQLATLKSDAKLFKGVDALRWNGPTDAFATWCDRMDRPRLLQRAASAATRT